MSHNYFTSHADAKKFLLSEVAKGRGGHILSHIAFFEVRTWAFN